VNHIGMKKRQPRIFANAILAKDFTKGLAWLRKYNLAWYDFSTTYQYYASPLGHFQATAFALATLFQAKEVVRELIFQKVEMGGLIFQESADSDPSDRCRFFSALDVAILSDNVEIVDLLLRAGANSNSPSDAHRLQPLQTAVVGSNGIIADLLIDAGADVDRIGAGGANPFMCAASKGDLRIMRLLRSAEANIYAVDENGLSAIHYAAIKGNAHAIVWLVERGLDINLRSFNGDTVLHFAAESCPPENIKATVRQIFSKCGTGILLATNAAGNRPLDFAYAREDSLTCIGSVIQAIAHEFDMRAYIDEKLERREPKIDAGCENRRNLADIL
jgi:hypothetical protein